MKLSLRHDLGGYALEQLIVANINETNLEKPFILFTGPNGSGKSAIMRAIRSSLGLRGERLGHTDTEWGDYKLTKEEADGDIGRLAAHVRSMGEIKAPKYVPAVVYITALGWEGQQTYLFDSREASSITKKGEFDHDIAYHVSMIAGGGNRVSHGQFVSKTWWEAIEWAIGKINIDGGHSRSRPDAFLEAALGGIQPSNERWLFIDEPETAIDSEALIIGLSVLLQAAETGRLRIFCASHSLLFAAGLVDHPKIQMIDLGGRSPWIDTQKIALRIAGDHAKIEEIGWDILSKMTKSDEKPVEKLSKKRRSK